MDSGLPDAPWNVFITFSRSHYSKLGFLKSKNYSGGMLERLIYCLFLTCVIMPSGSSQMSLRASIKLPNYGLFFVPSVRTTSIVPSKNVVRVIAGDNVTKGSQVVVKYEKLQVEAEIIAVDGMYDEQIAIQLNTRSLIS